MNKLRWMIALLVLITLSITVFMKDNFQDNVTLNKLNNHPLKESAHSPLADNILNGEWPAYGRDSAEQRYSPLSQINTKNIKNLGLAWHYDLKENRGVEASPLMVDGKLFVTSAWSVVHALDARTGKELWVHDPKADRVVGAKSCCGPVNRGLAYYEGKIYVAAIDGRLIALDMNTGKVQWETQTLDIEGPYVITGAPRAAKGLVFIGNSGADFSVRGYVGAYDAQTGKQVWRFYTVPGNPADGPDGVASDNMMAMAAKTWTGQWWEGGGGGTVWDSITYDEELDRIYIGVGNGAPWNQQVRSPDGGDNLFLNSIVALDRATGKYIWHYQTTPGDTWDMTSTQSMILSSMEINGKVHRTLMQAPKNGFFYVIDRDTGKFLSAANIVPMAKTEDTPKGEAISWAYGIDQSTGRPLENPEARFLNGTSAKVHPVGAGAHGWQPMAYSSQTGYVYIPVQDSNQTFSTDLNYRKGPPPLRTSGYESKLGLPKNQALRDQLTKVTPSRLIAWDPVTQTEKWRVKLKAIASGGVLATAGELVFQGKSGGEFAAYNATTGDKLWSFDALSAVQNGAISYELDGEQYIAVTSGSGGTSFIAVGLFLPPKAISGKGRLMVFKLGANNALPLIKKPLLPIVDTSPTDVTQAQLKQGDILYGQFCASCHGVSTISRNVTPDLKRSPIITSKVALQSIVKGGALATRGMPKFGDALSEENLELIRMAILDEAKFAREQEALKHKEQ